MSESEERGRLAEGFQLSHEKQIELAKILKDKGYSNAAIAHIMRLDESSVRTLLEMPELIEWGYNCLTTGIHHGRPEKLWNLPLLYAAQIYSRGHLKAIVVARIYNDAMQFVEADSATPEWAEQTKQYASDWYDTMLQHTVGEIARYYKAPERARDVQRSVDRLVANKLSAGYEPLHGHDSINLLCRILGTKASREASKDHGV
jgi:predicted ArsR family transcriptional regulator